MNPDAKSFNAQESVASQNDAKPKVLPFEELWLSHLKEHSWYDHPNGDKVTRSKESKCKEININLVPGQETESDIMKAWTRDWRRNIQDYSIDEVTGTGEKPKVTLHQGDWFERLPKFLILQLNRMQMHDWPPVKSKHEAPLPPTLCLNRFLNKNREKVLQAMDQAEGMTNEIRRRNELINKL